jgi:hypothetical protein
MNLPGGGRATLRRLPTKPRLYWYCPQFLWPVVHGYLRRVPAHKAAKFLDFVGDSIRRQAFREHLAVSRVLNAWIKHRENSAICRRTYEPSKSLLERNGRFRQLIVEESATLASLDRFHASLKDWITWHREWQAVDDDATQLLTLYINPLPE